MGNKGIYSTVDAGYKNTSYKNMPVIRTLTRFTESFVFYSIEIFAGYKNTLLENGCHIPYIIYAGYKNIICRSRRCSYNRHPL